MSTQPPEAPAQPPEQVSAANVVAAVLAVAAAYLAGKITAEAYARLAAAHIYAAKVVAARTADILVSTLAHRPPVGITPPRTEFTRLEAALLTIAADPDAFLTRSERIAVAEPAHEERLALQEAMKAQGYTQWQRVVQPDACEKCEPYRDEVQSIDRNFYDHPGCRCTLRPYGEPQTRQPDPDPEPLVRITKSVTTR